ncbi:MAG: rhomboid family intramembrane serine protease [Hyphomicrobiales bacterium]|nr:rhomboid family intramembrane serine protease [Hyphomicrobiales bacterium]
MTRAREPIFNVPTVVLAVAIVLTAIQIGRGFLSEETDFGLLIELAFIPAREISWLAPSILHGIVDRGPQGIDAGAVAQYELARYLLAESGPRPWTFLTYCLLHEGWLHLGLNVVVLSALGTPVARRFGALRFLSLLAFGALAGALMHLAVHPAEVAPLIGASASVSACMGAAARFVFDPLARRGETAPPLLQSLKNRTVISFTLGWFIANAMSGLGANPSVLANASIAWEAHIGGFLLGFLAFHFFDPRLANLEMPAGSTDEFT